MSYADTDYAGTESDRGGDPGHLSPLARDLYIAAGLGLAAASLKPRPNPVLSALALAGGSYLAWRGAVGHCPITAEVRRRLG